MSVYELSSPQEMVTQRGGGFFLSFTVSFDRQNREKSRNTGNNQQHKSGGTRIGFHHLRFHVFFVYL